MAVPALVDLVVRRAEADGAVVVALLGGARRHFAFVGRVAQVLFRATGLCSGLAAWLRVDSA